MSRATLFFDLDGTLIDSAVGITRCIAHALTQLEHPVPSEEELRGWIGPSLRTSFMPLLGDPARVEAAVEHYLERFESHGWLEHQVYAGIGDAVEALHADGHRLAVVTAKNEPHARKIVDGFDFADRFDTIVGATLDGRSSHKPELIAEALARLALHADECVMIGDRRMDNEGARARGLRSLGVLWGFGDAAELRLAGATGLVRAPAELPAAVAALPAG